MLALLTDGLSWASSRSETYCPPSKSAMFQARALLGAASLLALFARVAQPIGTDDTPRSGWRDGGWSRSTAAGILRRSNSIDADTLIRILRGELEWLASTPCSRAMRLIQFRAKRQNSPTDGSQQAGNG